MLICAQYTEPGNAVSTLCFKKAMTPWFFKNHSVKNEPILVIFGTQNPEETSHQMIISVSTSHVKCSHYTLWKADNFHLIEAIYISECIDYTSSYVRCNRLFTVRNVVHCRPKSCHHNISSMHSSQLLANWAYVVFKMSAFSFDGRKSYLLFTRYSGYILQVRWIHL